MSVAEKRTLVLMIGCKQSQSHCTGIIRVMLLQVNRLCQSADFAAAITETQSSDG